MYCTMTVDHKSGIAEQDTMIIFATYKQRNLDENIDGRAAILRLIFCMTLESSVHPYMWCSISDHAPMRNGDRG
jgi:hypothetical protein